MKGFKDSNNKFHPISQSKGVRKSRDQKEKTQGVKVERKKREHIPKCKSSDRAYCGECCQFEDCSDECDCRCQDYTPYSTWRSDEEHPTERKARLSSDQIKRVKENYPDPMVHKEHLEVIKTRFGNELAVVDRHGLSDFPILYENNTIAFDHPERVSKKLREEAHSVLVNK